MDRTDRPQTDGVTGHGRRSPDDVTGHEPTRRGGGLGAEDDTTGHMPRIRGNVHSGTGTEGVPAVDPHGTHPSDDVTGHMPRIRGGSRGRVAGRPAEGHPPR